MIDENVIENLIQKMSVWEIDTDGFKVFANVGKHPSGPYKHISNEKLQQIHPFLHEGIQALKQDNDLVFGVFIQRMLHIWSGNSYVLNTDNKQVSLSSVKDIVLTKNYLRFRGSGFYYREKVASDGETKLRIPLDSSSKMTTVNRKWMDDAYPNWHTRYQLACDLDLDLGSMEKAIFENPQIHQVTIPQDFSL